MYCSRKEAAIKNIADDFLPISTVFDLNPSLSFSSYRTCTKQAG